MLAEESAGGWRGTNTEQTEKTKGGRLGAGGVNAGGAWVKQRMENRWDGKRPGGEKSAVLQKSAATTATATAGPSSLLQ